MSPRIQGQGLRNVGVSGSLRLVCAGVCLALLAALGVSTAAAAPPVGTVPAFAGQSDVLVVGDSLAVGTEPFLAPMLPDRNLVTGIKTGITTPQGMAIVRRKLRVVRAKTVVLSLGTNDGSDPRRFAHRLQRMMALMPDDSCVIWATIIRPARKGEYRGLNRVLHLAKRQDPRLVVVDWEHAVTGGAVILPDGLHADEAGYRYRSTMIVNAVRAGCAARGFGAG